MIVLISVVLNHATITRQLQKWIIIIGLLLVDQYVVPVMQVYK